MGGSEGEGGGGGFGGHRGGVGVERWWSGEGLVGDEWMVWGGGGKGGIGSGLAIVSLRNLIYLIILYMTFQCVFCTIFEPYLTMRRLQNHRGYERYPHQT